MQKTSGCLSEDNLNVPLEEHSQKDLAQVSQSVGTMLCIHLSAIPKYSF